MTRPDLAAAWAGHLAEGGTIPWREFRDASSAKPWRGPLPGAQNLELLRRVNLTAPAGPALASTLLSAAPPGRGRPTLGLVGAGESRWGAAPVDPSTLPEAELLRLASGVLAQRLAACDPTREPSRRVRRWARPWTLAGDAVRATRLRTHLRADGRPPGGPAAHHVVLGAPMDQLLASAWTRRALGEGVRGWEQWLDVLHRTDRLPATVDLTLSARAAADPPGRRRVHVVLDPTVLPGLLGSRHLPAAEPLPSALGVDVARRVATHLGVLVPTGQRRALLWDRVRPALSAVPGPAPVVPERHRGWVVERAGAMAAELRRAGYAVHGDLDQLVPRTWDRAEPVGELAALQLAVSWLLDGAVWQPSSNGPGSARQLDQGENR